MRRGVARVIGFAGGDLPDIPGVDFEQQGGPDDRPWFQGHTPHVGASRGGGFYANVAVDDVTFGAAVPEPGTAVLLLAGLMGLSRARRRNA